jgi:large subunit ribosomal protein L22
MPVQTTARLRYVSIPPRKMRLVANLVKGMPIQKALDVLNFTPRVAASHIAKTLKSAAANALSIGGTAHVKPEDLFVKNIQVDAAPMAKRIRFQSMGRVFRYRKRFCHLTVLLEERAHQKPKAVHAAESTKEKTVKPADGTAPVAAAKPKAKKKVPAKGAKKVAKKKPAARAKKTK